ncbi:hypothetical protein [Nitrosopumilus adriaticus]|uniref:hypothetical protein n=1 Tax=Nitrosopumilus adriaticus TaxID=1580092 RepID=UPI00352CBC2B
MRLVELVYDGYSRIVEIHVYGKKNGKDGIMVYQIRGKSSTGKLGWKRMHLEKIVHLRVLREKFPGRRMTSDRHSSWDDTYFTVDE